MKANIIQDAWQVNDRICDATVTVRLDGVVLSIPGHSEIQLFITADDLQAIKMKLDQAGRLDGFPNGKWRREVVSQGGGITTKVSTAQRLEEEGFVTIHKIVYGGDVRQFDLDPARAACAARCSLTDAGEQILHMLNGGVG